MAVIKGISKTGKGSTRKKKEFKTLNQDDIVHLTLTEHATINLGDYESTKISFGLTVPTSVKNITDTRTELEKYVSEYISKKVMEIKDEI